MGYADIGEEEDWGKSTDNAEEHVDEQVTSKKRKDQGAGGGVALLLIQRSIWHTNLNWFVCSCIQPSTTGYTHCHFVMLTFAVVFSFLVFCRPSQQQEEKC